MNQTSERQWPIVVWLTSREAQAVVNTVDEKQLRDDEPLVKGVLRNIAKICAATMHNQIQRRD